MDWDKAVYGILSNDLTVTNLVANKIYPLGVEQGILTPFIVYSLDNTIPKDTKDSYNDLEVYGLKVQCYGKDWDEMNELKDIVRESMNRYNGTINGVMVHYTYYVNEQSGYNKKEEVDNIEISFELWLKA